MNKAQNFPKKESAIRYVQGNILISKKLPRIKIRVDEEFSYVGNFDFEIIASSDEYPKELIGKPVASGERSVFAANRDSLVDKLFIVQFEGFLTENDFIYILIMTRILK